VDGRRRFNRCGVIDPTCKPQHCSEACRGHAQACKATVVADHLCGDSMSFGREVRVPLGARPGGLGHFELVGFALGYLVRARWDGVELSVTEQLYKMALMSAAVEEVFRADEEEELDWSGGFGQRVALDLVGSMDVVAMVEYSMEGQRDVVRRTWYLGGMPGRAPSDPPHAE